MKNTARGILAISLGVAAIAVVFAWRQREQVIRSETAARTVRQQCAAVRAQTRSIGRRCADEQRELARLREALATRPSAPSPTQDPVAMKRDMEAAIAEAFRRMRVAQLVNDERYVRPKFEELGLTAAQWDAYKKLRLDQMDARQKVMTQGLQGEALKEALGAIGRDYEHHVQELLGADAYAALQDCQQRNARAERPSGVAARDLSAALLFTDAPLEPQQAESVTALVEAHVGKAHFPVLSPDTVERAVEFLSPAQMVAWRRIQDVYRHEQHVDDINAKAAAR